MPLYPIGRVAPKSTLLLALCLFLLTACGFNAGTSSGASATATACARAAQSATFFRAEIGTIKSMDGKTFVLTNGQGKSTTVTYSSTTKFTQEARIAASALKEGTPVSVVVTSAGSTYTAVSVVANNGMGTFINGGPGSGGPPATNGTPIIINGGPGGAPGGDGTPATTSKSGSDNAPCSAKQSAKDTTPVAGAVHARALVGTVSQVNGTLLTIADPTGASYTVTLTAQTQIIGTQSASAAALQVGEPLSVMGKADSQNAFAASAIEILLHLPGPASSPLA